jgi:type IV pilus assembly protein PilE
MNMNKRNKKSGFTIIELMIVIVIIAILLAIAYPSYTKYVRKAKRGDAQQLLLNWSINQEIWRANHSTYNTVGTAGATDSLAPIADHYTFGLVGTPTATAFTLSAAAISGDDQVNDKSRDNSVECKTLTLDQSGQKLPAECWE